MILTCPKCATRYLVDPAKIGRAGRDVRCARCSHEWWAEPPAESQAAPEIAPSPPAAPPAVDSAVEAAIDAAVAPAVEPAVAATPAIAAETQTPAEAAAVAPRAELRAIDPPLSPAEDVSFQEVGRREQIRSNLPALVKPKRRIGGVILLAVVVLALAIFNGLVLARETLLAAWPPIAQVYALIGMAPPQPSTHALLLHDVRTNRTTENGVPVLIVTGLVRSTADTRMTIPPIQLILRGADGEELANWLASAAAEAIGAGGEVNFSARLENPPEGMRNLEARIGSPPPAPEGSAPNAAAPNAAPPASEAAPEAPPPAQETPPALDAPAADAPAAPPAAPPAPQQP